MAEPVAAVAEPVEAVQVVAPAAAVNWIAPKAISRIVLIAGIIPPAILQIKMGKEMPQAIMEAAERVPEEAQGVTAVVVATGTMATAEVIPILCCKV